MQDDVNVVFMLKIILSEADDEQAGLYSIAIYVISSFAIKFTVPARHKAYEFRQNNNLI